MHNLEGNALFSLLGERNENEQKAAGLGEGGSGVGDGLVSTWVHRFALVTEITQYNRHQIKCDASSIFRNLLTLSMMLMHQMLALPNRLH